MYAITPPPTPSLTRRRTDVVPTTHNPKQGLLALHSSAVSLVGALPFYFAALAHAMIQDKPSSQVSSPATKLFSLWLSKYAFHPAVICPVSDAETEPSPLSNCLSTFHHGPTPPPPPRVLTISVELEMAIYGGATTQLVADILSAAGVPAVPGPYVWEGGGGGGGEADGDRPWQVSTDQSIVSQAILDEDAKANPHPGPRGTYAVDSEVPGKTKPPIAPNHATAPTEQNSYLQAELISRPFQDDLGKKMQQWHQEVHDALGGLERSAYTTDPNQSTRFHVHIGVGTQPEQVFTLEEAQKISALFLAYESERPLCLL